jgi:ABC-type nitrate/sulfonate/bicarbonate transport system permease component
MVADDYRVSSVISALSVAGGLALWEVVARISKSPELLPAPTVVANVFWEMLVSGGLLRAVLDSSVRVLVGYLLGATAGIGTGLVLGGVRGADKTLGLVFEFLKGIPPIALVPLLVIWLGIGEASKYAVIAYLVWIVVAITTAVGAREVPLLRLRAGAFLGLSRTETFLRIVLPSCVPYVVSGMRSAIGFAFVALVSAELVAANSGIGQIIMDARFSLQTPRMIVGLLVLGALGASSQTLFDLLISRFKIMARF